MPVYRRKKTQYARRYKPYAKKRTSRAISSTPTSIVQAFSNPRNGVYGFPSSFRTKLRYHEAIGLTSVSGTTVLNIFRANSLFDPNESGTGHQPMYFDQLAAIYSRYAVKASQIRVTFGVVTETAATSDFVVGIVGQLGGSLGSDPNITCEQPHSLWTTLNGRNGNSGTKTLTMKFTPQSCLNITNKDTDAGALCTTNPDQTYKYIIWAADRQATGSTQVVAEVEIIFDVEFSQTLFNSGS